MSTNVSRAAAWLLVMFGVTALRAQAPPVPRTVPDVRRGVGVAPANREGVRDVATTLRAAADALGMLRTPNRIDAIMTMEFAGTGTVSQLGPVEYRGSLSYPEPAMRLEMKRVATAAERGRGVQPGQGSARGTAAANRSQITVVNGPYAWNESEVGAGLVPGKGVATPAPTTVKERQLQLWTLPHGAIKAAMKAGDKTTIAIENGLTVIRFPFSGELEGVRAKVTLDARNRVSKVETQSDNPALNDLMVVVALSGYAALDEVQTDVLFPTRIISTQQGRRILDLRVTRTDTNNPYEVFPVPDSIRR